MLITAPTLLAEAASRFLLGLHPFSTVTLPGLGGILIPTSRGSMTQPPAGCTHVPEVGTWPNSTARAHLEMFMNATSICLSSPLNMSLRDYAAGLPAATLWSWGNACPRIEPARWWGAERGRKRNQVLVTWTKNYSLLKPIRIDLSVTYK